MFGNHYPKDKDDLSFASLISLGGCPLLLALRMSKAKLSRCEYRLSFFGDVVASYLLQSGCGMGNEEGLSVFMKELLPRRLVAFFLFL